MNFLFDLINHISGYTEKYYGEHMDKIDHEGLIQKYREEIKKYEGKIQDSPLFRGQVPSLIISSRKLPGAV
jgi:hypothetical protein